MTEKEIYEWILWFVFLQFVAVILTFQLHNSWALTFFSLALFVVWWLTSLMLLIMNQLKEIKDKITWRKKE